MNREGAVVPLLACLFFLGCEQPDPAPDRGRLSVLLDAVEFTHVQQVLADDSTVWVLDEAPPFVSRVDLPSGRVEQWGGRGNGPEEFQNPSAMTRSELGVSVFDFEKGVRIDYSERGAHLATVPLSDDRSGWIRPDFRAVSHLDPTRVRALGEDFVYARLPEGATHPVDVGASVLVRADASLSSIDELLAFEEHVRRDAAASGQFPSMPLWDSCGETGVVVWLPGSDAVSWLDLDGDVLATVPVDGPPVEITDRDVEAFLGQMARLELGPSVDLAALDLAARARDARPAIGKAATPYADLRCDAEGRAWLQRFDMADSPLGHSNLWLALGRDGAQSFVELPAHFEPGTFAGQSIIGVERRLTGDVLSTWRTE